MNQRPLPEEDEPQPIAEETRKRPAERQDHDADLVEPDEPLPEVTLADLPPALAEAAGRMGWTGLRPVQARAIPYMLAGRELLVQARTGSGKTGAFVLPILQRIDPRRPACQALVLVPTRELAQQVAAEAERLAAGTGVNIVSVYGGVGYNKQLDAFRVGAHLVVGTPGRILDHLIRRSLKLDALETLIFDEADRMLSMGFYPDMIEIRRHLPKRRKSCMFSATYTPRVRQLAGQFLDHPEFLSLSRDRITVSDTTHIYYEVPENDKDRCLVRIIEIENPESAIIFCNMKMRVNYVTTVLQRFGYDADQLTSDLAQAARDKVLDRARAGELQFLVATDVAARGIDIPDLSHVFLYDWPEDPESYVHRAGRTGRAGATGVAISLVGMLERTTRKHVAAQFKIDMELRQAPTDEQVEAVVAERATAFLEAKLRARDRLQIERMKRFLPLARGLAESEGELDLLAMLLDDFYQSSHHKAPTPGSEYKPTRTTADHGGEPRDRPPRRRSGGGSGGGGRRR